MHGPALISAIDAATNHSRPFQRSTSVFSLAHFSCICTVQSCWRAGNRHCLSECRAFSGSKLGSLICISSQINSERADRALHSEFNISNCKKLWLLKQAERVRRRQVRPGAAQQGQGERDADAERKAMASTSTRC